MRHRFQVFNHLDLSSLRSHSSSFTMRRKKFSSCGMTEISFCRHSHSAFQCIPARIQLRTTPGSQFSCTCLDKWLQVNKSLTKWNCLETPCSRNGTPWTVFFLSSNLLHRLQKDITKRRNSHCSIQIVVYRKLEVAGNTFQTKQTKYSWTHFTPKTNNSAELRRKSLRPAKLSWNSQYEWVMGIRQQSSARCKLSAAGGIKRRSPH